MPDSVTLNLVAVVTLAVQFKIFIYLFLSNRVRFFRYLVWAWGGYVGAETLEVAHYLLPGVPGLLGAAVALETGADFLVVGSALALRRNYQIRRWHALSVAAYALFVAVRYPPGGLAGGG